MNESVKIELSRLCQKVGNQIPAWTQGAGGNISIKEGNVLGVKATGYRLDAVRANQGIAEVDFKKMAYVLERAEWSEKEAEGKYANLIQETTASGPGRERASMETGFHARLERKYVLHFHSLAALLMCHEYKKKSDKVEAWLRKKTSLNWKFIEPCRPGWILSKKLSGASSIYFLESHGIVLQADDDAILETWSLIERDFCRDFNYPELLELLNAPKELGELFALYGKQAIPFKCYFPDVAVFADRLRKVLEVDKAGLCLLSQTAIERDRDMAELWLATLILCKLCPSFEEVPKEIASVIKDLPTEKLRQQREINHG